MLRSSVNSFDPHNAGPLPQVGVIIPTLQMWRLGLREVRWHPHGHTGLTPGLALGPCLAYTLIMPRFAGFFDARALAVDFRSIGFRECLTEVIRYLGVLEGPSSRADPVRIRLLSHLNSYAAEMEPSPTPTGPLAFPAWPWSFFQSCPGLSAPSNQLTILGRVPGPVLPSASSLAYPIPALRTTPVRRAAGTVLPARRNLLPSRGASSTRRARPLERPAAPLPVAPSIRAARSSHMAPLLRSSSPLPPSIVGSPAYVAVPAARPSSPGAAGRPAGAVLCHSWVSEITEIGAF